MTRILQLRDETPNTQPKVSTKLGTCPEFGSSEPTQGAKATHLLSNGNIITLAYGLDYYTGPALINVSNATVAPILGAQSKLVVSDSSISTDQSKIAFTYINQNFIDVYFTTTGKTARYDFGAEVQSAVFNSDQSTINVIAFGKVIRVDSTTGSRVETPTDWVTNLKVSPSGKTIVRDADNSKTLDIINP